MAYSKRNSRQIVEIIICIALVLLLSLSLALSITGAWFTNSASATISPTSFSFTFGTVTIGSNSVPASVTSLKPGDTIAYGGTTTSNAIVYTGNVSAYYRLKLTADNSDIEDNLSFTSNGAKVIYGELSPNGTGTYTISNGTITFSPNATNDLQNVAFNLVVTVDIIQKANLPGTYFDGNGDIIYSSLFGYYDSLS